MPFLRRVFTYGPLLVLASVAGRSPLAAQPTPPGIYISPADGAVGTSTPSVTITWTDGVDVNGGSRVIEVTKDGSTTNVTSSFSYAAEFTDPTTTGVLMARSVGTVALSTTGPTLVRAYICGYNNLACSEATAHLQYTPPPPPAQHAIPVIGLGLHSNWVRAENGGSTLGYSTPAYVSLDQPRSLSLLYFSEHADPTGLVQVEVTDPSTIPATAFSIRVLNASGVAQTLTNGLTQAYFDNQGGTTGGVALLAAQFSTINYPTGAHRFQVEVTSHWPGVAHSSTAEIVVLVVNRRFSRFGAGWTLAGLKSLHADPLGVMLDDADGSARYFRNDAGIFTSPPGDASHLTFNPATQRYHRTWPDGSGETYAASGQLLHAYALPADTVKYTYSANGDRVVAVTDPAGAVSTLQYHNGAHPHSDNLASITTPGGRPTLFGYWDGWGNLTAVQEPDGSAALVAGYQNPQGLLSWWLDRTGGRWDVSYDHSGAVQSLTAPTITVGGLATRPVTQRAAARRAALPQSGQGTSSSRHPRISPSDLATVVTSPRGGTTTTRTDRYGLPVSVLGPLGHTTLVERDSAGRPRVIHSPRGTRTFISYDGDSDVNGSFDQGRGVQSTVEYGTFSGAKLVTRTVSGGQETRYVRGTRGEILALVVQGDTVVWHTYDARYRVQTTRYRDGRVVTAFYDGTPWRNADSLRVAASGTIRATAYTFDSFGRVRTVRDPSGRVRTDSLDLLGRLLKRRAPGDSLRFTYDSVGLWRVTDAVGKVFEFRRNRLGWVEQEIDPNGRATTVAYDTEGNAVSTTDRMGRTYTATFDLLGRPLTHTAPGLAATAYTYHNPFGEYFVVDNGETRDSVAYNSAGQVASVVSTVPGTVTGGAPQTFRIESAYGIHGFRRYRTVSSPAVGTSAWAATVEYNYDAHQRLSAISDNFAATSVSYDVPGRLQKLTYPGTLGTLDLGYDPRSQLSSYSYSRSNLHGEFGSALTYDVLGRRTGRTWQSGWRQRVHSYDGPGRMTTYADQRWSYVPPPWFCDGQVTDPICDGSYDWAPVGSGTFAYDAVGNRTSWSVADSLGATAYSSASLQPTSNRYAAFDGWTMTYDTVGNLARRQKGSLDVQYHWNSLGQLTGVWTPASGLVSYFYNGFGMRVRRTHAGTTLRYLYDGAELAAEVNGSGNPLRTYTHFPGIDQPHSMRTWSGTTAGAPHYYALDLPGNNVQGLFSSSGTVTHRYRYSPWGEAQVTSEASPNPLRFASRELDATTGLYYNRARWYDPYLGRFLSEDPIGIEGGINVYAYAGNDPVNWSDPLGLSPCPPNYYGCGNTFGLPGITVRAGGWYTSMIDVRGGLSDLWGGGKSIMGGMVRRFADSDEDLQIEAAATEQERSVGQRVAGVLKEVVWGECTGDAAGLVLGAVAGKLGKMIGNKADALRNHADDLYRVGSRQVQDIASMRRQAIQLYQSASRLERLQFAAEFTQVGATLVGIYELSTCVADHW